MTVLGLPGGVTSSSSSLMQLRGAEGLEYFHNLSKAFAREGLVVCPSSDPSSSRRYDLQDLKLVRYST